VCGPELLNQADKILAYALVRLVEGDGDCIGLIYSFLQLEELNGPTIYIRGGWGCSTLTAKLALMRDMIIAS
jgi:hypothetical protein